MQHNSFTPRERQYSKYSTYFKVLNLCFIPLVLICALLFNWLIPENALKLDKYITYTLFFSLIITNIFYLAYCGIKHNILPELMGGRPPVIGKNDDMRRMGWLFLTIGLILSIGYIIFSLIYFL